MKRILCSLLSLVPCLLSFVPCLLSLVFCPLSSQAAELSFKVKCKYLNLPISHEVERRRLTFQAKGVDDLSVVARLSDDPEYWVFKDITAYKGKTLTITYDGPEEALARVTESLEAHRAQKNEVDEQSLFLSMACL